MIDTSGQCNRCRPLALDAAILAHLVEIATQAADLFHDAAAVNLKLLFARPARADAAALTREVRPQTSQTRQHVLELREFNLDFAFTSAGALGENIEDQFGAVEYLDVIAEDF